MDNAADAKALLEGADRLGITLPEAAVPGLLRFRDELLKWNQRVNLTAITEPREVLEKHLLDSLAVLPELGDARTVLDVGSGGGFPGIPLRLVRPDLQVTLVDAVEKKVAFMKNAVAQLRLFPGSRAVHVRVEGEPSAEGLPLVDLVVSRALMDVADWVPLATRYRAAGGRVLSMLGQAPARVELESVAAKSGLRLHGLRTYQLPWSHAERAVAVFGD